MKVRVIKDRGGNGYLSVGKVYNVIDMWGKAFEIEDDEGNRILCLLKGCAHGYDYEVVDE